MTVNIAIANSSDAEVASFNDDYTDTQDGSNLAVQTQTSQRLRVGQRRNTADTHTYKISQSFISYAYVHDSTQLIASAYFRFSHHIESGTNTAPTARNIGIRFYNFGATVDTSDWRTTTQLSSLPLIARLNDYQNWADGVWTNAGDENRYDATESLNNYLDATKTIYTIVYSGRAHVGDLPAVNGYDEIVAIKAQNYTGFEPRLVWHTLPASNLSIVLGGAVQLSDGTHAFLETNSFLTQVLLKHNNGSVAGTHTTIASTGLDNFLRMPTAQAITLVADPSDNLYVIGQSNDGSGWLRVRAYIKSAGHTWTAGTIRTAILPSSMANQYAAAWHPGGSAAGVLFVVAGRQSEGTPSLYDPMWGILNCSSILSGSGSVLMGSGDRTQISSAPSISEHQVFRNPVGTGIDVAAAPNSARGFVATFMYQKMSLCRYELNSTRTGILNHTELSVENISYDAAGKVRVQAISDSQVAKSYGTFPFDVWQSIGSGPLNALGFTTSTQLRDNLSTLTGIDVNNYFANNAAWDVIYSPDDNKLWLYYLDVANNRRLMKTGFNLTTSQASLEQIEVATNIGAVGSTNLAIRLPRGGIGGGKVHIAVANRTSGGTLSTVYLYDTLNAPPNAPTLTSQENYDATGAKTFAWSFQDPNLPGDSQTAYELEIKRVSDGVNVVATGKVTSGTASRNVTGGTLANAETYQWRVRTWDTGDLVGPYSEYDQFLTSAAGTVTITDPATDNPAGQIVSSYDVDWSVAGATQQEYRVQMLLSGVSDYLQLSGAIGSYASTVDNAVLDITGDLDLRAWIAPDNWTAGVSRFIAGKYSTVGNQRSYGLRIKTDNGLQFTWSVDGIASLTASSTVNPTPGGDGWLAVRVTIDVDNGAAGRTIKFYTASSMAGPWTQLGADVVQAGVTSVFSGTAAFTVGSRDAGAGELMPGKFRAVELRSGIDGTIVANPDFTIQTVGGTSFTDAVGRTWTVSGDASIVGLSSILHDSGWVTSTATTYTINDIPSDEEVTFSVQIRSGGVASLPGTRKYTTSYATPLQPIVTTTPVPSEGYILIGVENPEPPGDVVQIQYNQILRRRADAPDSEPYLLIGTTELNGELRDYSVASRVSYVYVARGQA
jgi:hypothetical protein